MVEKFYLVMADEKIVVNEDGTVEVTLDAFRDDEEEPITLTLNLGDNVEDIVRLFTRIIAIASAEAARDG